jgi:SAM-dependent methyltransferase
LTHALPALKKQKREMARQTLQLLGSRRNFDGYLEIGSIGRYLSVLRKQLQITGPTYVCNDAPPSNSLGDIMERGGLGQLGQFLPLDYQPFDSKGITPASLDLVTCFIGLHHAPLDLLEPFVNSIHRILRPGGTFIVRDHDVRTREMHTFVSLVHTVFNLGLGVPWEVDQKEFKRFRAADEWSKYLSERGFRDQGARLRQDNDPSDNLLMAFVKP